MILSSKLMVYSIITVLASCCIVCTSTSKLLDINIFLVKVSGIASAMYRNIELWILYYEKWDKFRDKEGIKVKPNPGKVGATNSRYCGLPIFYPHTLSHKARHLPMAVIQVCWTLYILQRACLPSCRPIQVCANYCN